jgi:hypothetical protein
VLFDNDSSILRFFVLDEIQGSIACCRVTNGVVKCRSICPGENIDVYINTVFAPFSSNNTIRTRSIQHDRSRRRPDARCGDAALRQRQQRADRLVARLVVVERVVGRVLFRRRHSAVAADKYARRFVFVYSRV